MWFDEQWSTGRARERTAAYLASEPLTVEK